ncbi:MAG: hypothetical protein V1806_10940 [Pseudomonadota bacterium]
MDRPQAKPRENVRGPQRRVTTLAEVVAALQDTCDDDRQVVCTLRQMMRQGALRRLMGRMSRAA